MLNTSEKLLAPNLHPAQVLAALKQRVDKDKMRLGYPVHRAEIHDLISIWRSQKWGADHISKTFALVLGAFIPVRITCLPDAGQPFVNVDGTRLDAYYGKGAAARPFADYLHRHNAASEQQVADELDWADVLPPEPKARKRPGQRAAEEAGEEYLRQQRAQEMTEAIGVLIEAVPSTISWEKPANLRRLNLTAPAASVQWSGGDHDED